MWNKYLTLVVVISLLWTSCEEKRNIGGDPLIDYLNIVHNVGDISDSLYHILPLQSCTPCLTKNMALLLASNFSNVQIIFVGEAIEPDIKNNLSLLKERYLYKTDSLSQIFNYDIIIKPKIIYIKENKIQDMIVVDDFSINDARAFIDKYMSNP